jgi:hypothetical protein
MLAADICLLMSRRSATDPEGMIAMIIAFMIVAKDHGVTKQEAVALVAECWNRLEPIVDRLREQEATADE